MFLFNLNSECYSEMYGMGCIIVGFELWIGKFVFELVFKKFYFLNLIFWV